MWVLTGFMGAAYYVVPEESRTEIYSEKLAYAQLIAWTGMGLVTVTGYVFGWTAGNKLLEQPVPMKLVIVVVMLAFLFNIVMTIWKAGRWTTTEGVLVAGSGALGRALSARAARLRQLHRRHLLPMVDGASVGRRGVGVDSRRPFGVPADSPFRRRSRSHGKVAIRHRRTDVHRRDPGYGPPLLLESVPPYWAMFGGFFSALEPLSFFGMAVYAYSALRRSGLSHPNRLALHWTIGSAVYSAIGAGILGLAHTWPAVNKWTHGTLITAMHGHMAFFGAYVMIVLAMITFAMPGLTGRDEEKSSARGMWAFWLQVIGMLGMTMAFAAAGIVQTYLEHILGMGYLDTQPKLAVHFIMLIATGSLFALGVLSSSDRFLLHRATGSATNIEPALTRRGRRRMTVRGDGASPDSSRKLGWAQPSCGRIALLLGRG